MSPSTQRRFNRGFSLLEVLFAVIILAVALLATARLHAMVTQDGSYSKARGIAANLAQAKLDDLKSFSVLYNDPDILGDECAAPKYCYSEITADTGGKEKADGTLELISGDITVGNTTYNRTWVVTDYYNCTVATVASSSNCTPTKPYPDFKAVTLTVTWSDEKGATQTVTMQTAIYASDPGSQVRMAASSSGGGPKVSYTPIGVPDAVPVPINTGGTKFKESSKPVPDVISNGAGVEVSFDAVSYVNNGNNGYDTTEREEFTTVSCECSFNSTASAYTPSRVIWNGSSLEAKVGEQVSKPIGTALSGQSDFCTACCKDHHDVGGYAGTAQPKYDPDRPSSEYAADGDHKHYWYSGCVAGGSTLGKTTGCNAGDKNPPAGYSVVDSGAYLDSCRFKRVDGLWRLWQDWRQVKMTVMPYDFLPVIDNLNAYVEVIEAVVESTVRTDSSIGTSPAIPALTVEVNFNAAGETKQLLGRAVFVDRVYKKAAPTVLDTDYYTSLTDKVDASSDWLHLVPFYEANLTLLIDWSSDATTKATVTSQAIVDISDVSSGYYSSYSRGKVTAVAGGTAVITAQARLHNTGVTGGINTSSPSYGIGVYDNTVTTPTTDSITVTVPSSTTNVGISGKLIRSNSSVTFSTLSVSGATCTLGSAIGNELPYSCTTASGTNVTLAYASSASGYSFSPASQALGVVTSATTAGTVTVYGPTVQISGTFTQVNNPNMAKVNVQAVPSSGTPISCSVTINPATYTCTVNRGTTGFTGTVQFTETDSSSTYTFSPTSPHSYANQQADIVQNVTVTK